MTIDQIMHPSRVTRAQVAATQLMTLAIAEAIREARQIPSGTLYAAVCDKIDIGGYETVIRTLKNAGLVSEEAHMLRWTGREVTK
jgi:hypothetical protein